MPLFSGINSDQQWQINNGFAVAVAASKLTTDEFAGRGVYQPDGMRDFRWVHIEKAVREGNSVRIFWLDTEAQKDVSTREGDVSTTVKETLVVRENVCVPADQVLVVSKQPCGKPNGSRTTIVTTRETLGDDKIVDR